MARESEMGNDQLITFAFQSVLYSVSHSAHYIAAALILWFAYRLLRLGIEKVAIVDTGVGVNWLVYVAFVGPGAIMGSLAVVFILDHGPMALLLYFMITTVFVGFGFAVLGYRLFDKGVLGESDVSAVWKDTSLLLKKAAPGTIFALFGLVMIAAALWRGTGAVQEFNVGERTSQERMMVAIEHGITAAVDYLEKNEKDPAARAVKTTNPDPSDSKAAAQ